METKNQPSENFAYGVPIFRDVQKGGPQFDGTRN